jgi:hypothetical protein
MKRTFHSMFVASLAALAAATPLSYAQTPGQMEYERQQREYWRQQEQQRQEQQRQQQIMQENARRQQQESSRINAPQGSASQGGATGGAQSRGGAQSAGDNLSAARAQWEKRPPLPPDKNPLLGRWTRPASAASKSSDPFAGLAALAKGGLCEALFGGGVFEFRPDRLVGMDAHTRGSEQELDRVEYRGDAKHVVVIPKTTLKLMDFDVESSDRINWASQKCVLVRVKGSGASTTAGAATTTAAPAGSSSTRKSR